MFFQFHIRNAVHQKAADPVGTLKHRYKMPSPVQLVGHRQAGWAAPHNRNGLSGPRSGWFCRRIAFFISVFNNRIFVFSGGNGFSRQITGTGRFTQSRTHPCRKFRKIVGLFQAVIGLFPVSRIDEVVPFRNQIVQRAARRHAAKRHARLAERNAAVHTARPLLLLFFHRKMFVELVKVFYAQFRAYIRRNFTLIF